MLGLRVIFGVATLWYLNGAMAEWSKAVDLSLHDIYSTGEIRVGSNPTGTIIFWRCAIDLFASVIAQRAIFFYMSNRPIKVVNSYNH